MPGSGVLCRALSCRLAGGSMGWRLAQQRIPACWSVLHGPTVDEPRASKVARLLRQGKALEAQKAYGRKRRETEPRGYAGINPSRG
jgi:hypothetical protein